MKPIRLLTAAEIDVRLATSNSNGASLLLYKDARCDMRMLDEVFGPMNWQRSHEVIDGRLYCNVSVWDEEKHQWITKQDVGTESNTEKEKGQASDAFKRACFNFGIGRELYTAPFIWVSLAPSDFDARGKVSTRFFVKSISYNENREINALTIVDGKGNVRYETGKRITPKAQAKDPAKDPEKAEALAMALQEVGAAASIDTLKDICNQYREILGKDRAFVSAVNKRVEELSHAA